MNERDLFVAALQIEDGAERSASLDRACAGDAALRQRVEALLAAFEQAGSFLQRPAADARATSEVSAPGPSNGSDPAEGPGAVVGPYKLLEQIGEGGMGAVWLAEQTEPVRRKVAVKLIKPGMDTRQVLARFEAERQALALMDHPHIAKVFDGGATADGRPYFVMELVKGVPITRYCDDHRLTPHERLELFVPVCQAIQHAHQKGIIHRDLKPSNVLVAPYDGRPVVKVIDFGLAKAAGQPLTDKTLFTGLGTVVGTPEYMSPEQAELNNQDVDTRSDVYSLGVLLYELLTGTTPLTRFRVKEAALLEVLRVIREEEPPKPSTRLSEPTESLPTISAQRHTEPAKLTKLMRGELDWIVMKALEKDRNRRYESVSAFAADVRRYLNDEPVLACPPSPWYRFHKFARRNKRALATGALLGVMLLVAGGAVVASALWGAVQAKARLEVEVATKKELETNLYFTHVALAERELSANNLGRALQLLSECPKDLREWEWHYLMRRCREEPVILRDQTEVNSLAFSHDGEFLASAGGDGTVKVWNLKTHKVVQTLPAHDRFACSVAFHRDGKHLASVGADGQVKVWDWKTGEKVFFAPCDAQHPIGTAYAAAFSPDGRQLAAGSAGDVNVWDWKNRQLLYPPLAGQDKHRLSVAFSRDGGRLASGSWRGSVQIWDAKVGGEALCTLPKISPQPVVALAFNPDGTRLATANYGRRVDVWDTATGGRVHKLPHPGGFALGVAFSPDGRRLASACEDKIVRIWDPTTGREVLGLRGHAGTCGCLAFSPEDGRRLASASTDGTIRVWDATPLRGDEDQDVLTLRHSDEIWSVAVSPDGKKIVSAGWGTLATVWDVQTGRESAKFSGHRNVVFCVTWQPDGRRIASAGINDQLYTVKVWDAQTEVEDFALPAIPISGDPAFFTAAFSPPDGQYLVTGRENGAVQVWDARTSQEVGTLGTHKRAVRGVVFSHVGGHLASISADGVVNLWDATRLDKKRLDEKKKARLTFCARAPGQYSNVAFSPDGQRLATVGEKNTVKIRNVETGKELKTLGGDGGEIYTVAFSPDLGGRWVASAGEDSTVKIWDSHTGELRRTLRGHTGLVTSVAFTADGRRLVSGSRDHTVKVWDVTELEEVPGR